MVFVGRPVVYALSYDGQEGVESIFEILRDEFVNTAQLCGAASMDDIGPDMVLPADSQCCHLPEDNLK